MDFHENITSHRLQDPDLLHRPQPRVHPHQPAGLAGQSFAVQLGVPGRPRLPWGENPQRAYNLTLNNLDAMFASHEITQPKQKDEFRVVLIGDSSTWGFLLKPEDTLAAQLQRAQT